MRAQVTLTSAESKKLIGKGVVKTHLIQRALERGIIVIHPSTTTAYIMEEITGAIPLERFVLGLVLPEGTCSDRRIHEFAKKYGEKPGKSPDDMKPWVIENGKRVKGTRLGDLLEKMGPNDVYIKTGNTLDVEGNVGVFVGNPVGGTIGRAYPTCKVKGVNLVIPIGLEKLIPIPVREAAKEAGQRKMDYSMGMPVGLLPIDGTVVTEVEAIKILTGAKATPIGAGGVKGAEGAVTLVVSGSDKQVREAIEIIRLVKGTKLPEITPSDCATCGYLPCPHRGGKHPIRNLLRARA